jgi:hypothetical protein
LVSLKIVNLLLFRFSDTIFEEKMKIIQVSVNFKEELSCMHFMD